jgi:hypothetical protein
MKKLKQILVIEFDKEYNRGEVLEHIEGFYLEWLYPRKYCGESEMIAEIETTSVGRWVTDHLCDYDYHVKNYAVEDLIILTKEEKKELKEYLRWRLEDLAEYHSELYPSGRASLDTLLKSYFYWGSEHNDNYLGEGEDPANRVSMYLAQEFKDFLATPVSIRY